MRKNTGTFLKTTFILVILGIYVQAQPTRVTEIPNESTDFVTIGDLVYFMTGNALWRTDGTASGTFSVKDYYPWAAPDGLTEFNGMAMFRIGGALWRSDGSPGGTMKLAGNLLGYLSSTDKYFFFRGGSADTGFEVYRTDGTLQGTQLVKDISPGTGDGYRSFYGTVGNHLLFSGNDGIHGTELWKSDGTSAGTVMVKDINPGPADGFAGGISTAFSYDNLFYFRAETAETGNEPWVSDGTAEGTKLLKDIVEGPGSPVRLSFDFGHEQSVYFVEMTQSGYPSGTIHLWKTSGTIASTTRIKTIGEPGTQHYLHSFLPYQDKIYFFENQDWFEDVLWVTDGTAAGTNSFFRISTEGPDHYFDEVNNYMLFTDSDESLPTNFYRSDGTSSGTQVFTTFKSGPVYNGEQYVHPRIATVNDLAFYADHDGPTDEGTRRPYDSQDYLQLMQTDGAITQSVRTLHGVSTVGTDNITNFKDKVIFTTRNDQDGSTDTQKYLWIYDPSAPANTGAGKLSVETWNGVSGTHVSSIPVNSPPSSTSEITIFETPKNIGDNYGSRVRGYVIPPATGNYTFWIASDDRSELWLSTDATPANKRLIASVTGWTNPRQWDKYTGQTSAPVSLVAGRKYYVEALLKEGTGGDHLAVGWQLPNGTMERPIPGSRLLAFGSDETPPEACAGTGMIRQEFWTGVSGTRVSDIPVSEEPDFRQDLTIFEGPASPVGDNYGSRIRGYICPPASGQYIFWIAGDDQVELSLSTDDNPANQRRVAYHTSWTNKREWTKYTTQQSAPITLQAGQRYYIEALMKEGTGGDHVSVGWQQPDGTMERPIAGSRLIPFGASDPDPDPVCAGTGTISVETWTGIDGAQVSLIPVNSSPNLTGERNIFEAPNNIGNNFGSRFRGYVCVPTSGNYTFWIASDDHSELWLSTDADPANKRRIAYHTGWTSPRQWTKYTTQQSTPISLVAGQQYYIEALYKEDEGGDNMAVGWQLPDGTMERPIPGNRLSPFEKAGAMMMAETTTDENAALYSQISVYPNPARSGDPELTISGYEGIEETIETQVEIINMTGEVVFAEQIQCGGNCGSYLVNVNKQLVPGVYVVNMKTNGVRTSKRLLVK